MNNLFCKFPFTVSGFVITNADPFLLCEVPAVIGRTIRASFKILLHSALTEVSAAYSINRMILPRDLMMRELGLLEGTWSRRFSKELSFSSSSQESGPFLGGSSNRQCASLPALRTESIHTSRLTVFQMMEERSRICSSSELSPMSRVLPDRFSCGYAPTWL